MKSKLFRMFDNGLAFLALSVALLLGETVFYLASTSGGRREYPLGDDVSGVVSWFVFVISLLLALAGLYQGIRRFLTNGIIVGALSTILNLAWIGWMVNLVYVWYRLVNSD